MVCIRYYLSDITYLKIRYYLFKIVMLLLQKIRKKKDASHKGH